MALELVRDDESERLEQIGGTPSTYYDEVSAELRRAAGTIPPEDRLRGVTLRLSEAYSLRAARMLGRRWKP